MGKAKAAKLGGAPRGCLEVEVAGHGKTWRLPLAGDLSIGDAMEMRKALRAKKAKRDERYFEWFYGFVCRHLPEKVVSRLSMEDFATLAQAWDEASGEAGEAPGE